MLWCSEALECTKYIHSAMTQFWQEVKVTEFSLWWITYWMPGSLHVSACWCSYHAVTLQKQSLDWKEAKDDSMLHKQYVKAKCNMNNLFISLFLTTARSVILHDAEYYLWNLASHNSTAENLTCPRGLKKVNHKTGLCLVFSWISLFLIPIQDIRI